MIICNANTSKTRSKYANTDKYNILTVRDADDTKQTKVNVFMRQTIPTL